MCFDACPVTACLPYTAKRMRALTPDAKLIFMVGSADHRAFETLVTYSLNCIVLFYCSLILHPTGFFFYAGNIEVFAC